MAVETFPSLQIQLDQEARDSLFRLARWSKILGAINYGLGAFNGILSVPLLFKGHQMAALSIPSIFVSGILIYMGIQLNGASSKILMSIAKESDQDFTGALDRIQKFFFFSATLYLIGSILFILILTLGLMTNTSLPEPSDQPPTKVSI